MISFQSRLSGSASKSCLNVHIMDIDVNPDPERLLVSLLKLLGLTASCHYIYSSGGATTPYNKYTHISK